MSENNIFQQEAAAMQEQLVAWRRELHRMPETGIHLPQTMQFIREKLEEMGIAYELHEDISCITATIGSGGKCFLLRSDVDALPVAEEADVPFKSTNGCMHGCGHDLHGTILLGAAKLLQAHEQELKGTVKLLFQSGEEVFLGAKSAIGAGVLENPRVDAVFGGHNSTGEVPGVYGLKYDKCYAASNTFTVTVKGKGCHGAYPGSGLDPIVVASQIVVGLQTLTSRRIYATDSAIVTVGSFHAGTAGNIIPETVELKGTIRTLGPKMRADMCRWFTELVEGTAKAMGAEAIVDLRESHPGVVNEEAFTALVHESMAKLVGRENIRIAREPNMGTEDFGAFMKRDLSVPGCFCSFGFGDGGVDCKYPAHSPFHRINEDGLAYAAALFAQVCFDYLNK